MESLKTQPTRTLLYLILLTIVMLSATLLLLETMSWHHGNQKVKDLGQVLLLMVRKNVRLWVSLNSLIDHERT